MPSGPPNAGVLIYDGDCGFCTVSANWFTKRATKEPYLIAPWQVLDLDDYGLTEAQTQAASYFVGPDGVAQHGSDGIAAALQLCDSSLLRLAGKVMAVPPVIWVARALYPVIAKNRHRLPGATDACRLPS